MNLIFEFVLTLKKNYTELLRDFFEVDCVERVTQRRLTYWRLRDEMIGRLGDEIGKRMLKSFSETQI